MAEINEVRQVPIQILSTMCDSLVPILYFYILMYKIFNKKK